MNKFASHYLTHLKQAMEFTPEQINSAAEGTPGEQPFPKLPKVPAKPKTPAKPGVPKAPAIPGVPKKADWRSLLGMKPLTPKVPAVPPTAGQAAVQAKADAAAKIQIPLEKSRMKDWGGGTPAQYAALDAGIKAPAVPAVPAAAAAPVLDDARANTKEKLDILK